MRRMRRNRTSSFPMAKKPITLIAEPDYSPSAVAAYRKLGPVCFWFGSGKKERARYLASADILVVRLALSVTKRLMDQMPRLKVIATSTTGLNHIDVLHARARGVTIISLRGHTSFLKTIPSTAEETMALLLALVRNIPWAFEDVKNGKWRTNLWAGRELAGKTFGIVGFGRLGNIVAKYANAFGMNVWACDPYVPARAMRRWGVKKVSMETAFKQSDVVSLHVLLTDGTHDLVKEKHLKMMKPTAYFINTARAELIEPGALYKALKNRWIAGAAIDVMRDERPNGGHLEKDPLWQYAKTRKNLIIVPHIGGTTYEAMAVTQEFIAAQVLKHCKRSKLVS